MKWSLVALGLLALTAGCSTSRPTAGPTNGSFEIVHTRFLGSLWGQAYAKGMRYCAFIFLAVVLASCTPRSPVSDTPLFHSLLGTWQWVRPGQDQSHNPFYIRFYSDGRAATWPGLQECVYRVSGDYLTFRAGAAQSHHVRVKVRLTGNELVLIGSNSNRFICHRVVPDLRPGQLLPGQMDNDATPHSIIELLRSDPAP